MRKKVSKIAGAILLLSVISFGEDFTIYASNTENTEITEEKKECTIRYELNGGINSEENPESYVPGIGVSSFHAPYKFEHNFEGWYYDAAFQNKVEKIDGDITGDIVLYAKWSLYNYDYTIHYNTNYGFNGETNPSGYYEGVGVHKLEDASRKGYTFEGWYLKDDKAPYTRKIESIDENSSGDIYIEAKFTPSIYKVEYELYGGVLPEETKEEYTFGEGMESLPVPVLETKRLEGWYTDEEFTKQITSIDKLSYGDMKLYAKWIDAQAESITLNVSSLSIKQDAAAYLQVTEILPADTADKTITYESSNPSIATVDADGKITGIAAGNAVISAKVGEIQESCQVTILPYTVAFQAAQYDVRATKKVTVKVQLEPGDKVKKYTSSNTKIATVTSKGVVKGKKAGTVKITVETVKGAKAACKVKVSPKTVKTKKITVNKSKVVLKKGATFKIKVTISPSTSTEPATYQSSDKKVASVNSKGVIKGKRKGNCIITVKSGSKTKRILVTVK